VPKNQGQSSQGYSANTANQGYPNSNSNTSYPNQYAKYPNPYNEYNSNPQNINSYPQNQNININTGYGPVTHIPISNQLHNQYENKYPSTGYPGEEALNSNNYQYNQPSSYQNSSYQNSYDPVNKIMTANANSNR